MSMLVKDTRSQDGIDDKDNDKGSKSRSQSMKEQAYNKEQRERPRPHELNDKSNLIDLMKECQGQFLGLELFLQGHSNVFSSKKGINPMIQPEPEDLPKDNPKLEIAVLRWQSALASEY
ncbi:hypothetical protein Tco_1522565 [Tanacetum coccineum]